MKERNMQRKDRARIIRDAVMAEIEQHGKWAEGGGARYRNVETERWGAMLLTPFGTLHKKPEADTAAKALYLQSWSGPKPYQIDVWLTDGGKVISFEWSGDADLRIISMQRGAWEQELFGLP